MVGGRLYRWLGLVLLLLGAALPAQAVSTRNEVVGLGQGQGQGQGLNTVQLRRQKMDFVGCAEQACTPLQFPAATVAWAGGTAFNGDVPPNLSQSLGGIWISNGTSIASVDPVSCAYRCQPQPAPLVGQGAVVTGLAYVESDAVLFMSDSNNLLYCVKPVGCGLGTSIPCTDWATAVIPAGWTIGGLATDDNNRQLYVAASKFSGPLPMNKIYVANIGFPPVPIPANWCGLMSHCEMTVPSCVGVSLGPLTGLAYDACTNTLYYTDGNNTVAATVNQNPAQGTCSLTVQGCCTRPGGDPLGGLCVVQRSVLSSGSSCVKAPCTDCPNMVAGTVGDPYMGNRFFAFTLNNAPTGSQPLYLVIGLGGCVSPGINAGYCANVLLSPTPPTLLFPVGLPPVGSGPCDGNANANFLIPKDPGLCGILISAQWGMECDGPSGAKGNAISNCLTLEIVTN